MSDIRHYQTPYLLMQAQGAATSIRLALRLWTVNFQHLADYQKTKTPNAISKAIRTRSIICAAIKLALFTRSEIEL